VKRIPAGPLVGRAVTLEKIPVGKGRGEGGLPGLRRGRGTGSRDRTGDTRHRQRFCHGLLRTARDKHRFEPARGVAIRPRPARSLPLEMPAAGTALTRKKRSSHVRPPEGKRAAVGPALKTSGGVRGRPLLRFGAGHPSPSRETRRPSKNPAVQSLRETVQVLRPPWTWTVPGAFFFARLVGGLGAASHTGDPTIRSMTSTPAPGAERLLRWIMAGIVIWGAFAVPSAAGRSITTPAVPSWRRPAWPPSSASGSPCCSTAGGGCRGIPDPASSSGGRTTSSPTGFRAGVQRGDPWRSCSVRVSTTGWRSRGTAGPGPHGAAVERGRRASPGSPSANTWIRRLSDYGIRHVFGLPGEYVLTLLQHARAQSARPRHLHAGRTCCAGFAADA
jgi:hypothetical protein